MPHALSRIAAFLALLLIAQPISAALCEYRCLPATRDVSSGPRGRQDVKADVAGSCHGSEQDQTATEPESSNGAFLTSAPAVCVHDAESVTFSLVVEKSARVNVDGNALTVSMIFSAVNSRAPFQKRASDHRQAPPGTAPLLYSLLRV